MTPRPPTPGHAIPTPAVRDEDPAALAAEVQRLRVDVERLGGAERLQRALFAISDLASSDQDTPDVLRGLHEIVGRLMYAENFYIVRYSPEPETMRFIYFADTQDPVCPDPLEDIPVASMSNSLTLALIRRGRPVLGPSDEVRRELGVTRDETLGPDSEDWLGVPMVDEGVVRGAVVVQSYDPHSRYSDDERVLLGYVAQHILTALARRDAQEELERRVDERTRELREQVVERERSEKLQAALFRIAEQAASSESVEVFYSQVHGIVSDLLDARNFFIAVLTADGGELEFPYSVDERDQKRPRRRLAKGLTEYVLASGQPLLADRDAIHSLVAEGKVQSFGTPSVCWLGVPLHLEGRPVGVIAVQSYTPDYLYTRRDQELLSFVSFHIAQALERRRANESLREAYAELEQRVASRTSELADANRELLDQISVRERMEHKLKHEAMHDTLTGLPNRSHLLGRMGTALARFRHDPHQLFAVLFLDLDRFKVVNDSVGHLVGDELLKEAARRIGRCVRDPDMVARLGGDEFAIVLDFIHAADDAVAVAERVIKSLAEPMRIAGKELYTSASIGIALVDGRYRSPEELLRDADVAMYRAKANGRQRYSLFDEHLHDAALKLLELEGDLRRALQRQEFEPFYQPIVSLADGKLVGFEALMRWHHPQRGLLAPGEFIAIAEETGSLEPMDWQLYDLVCADLRRLSAGGAYATLNVSPRHLRAPDFDQRLLELMSRHAVKPGQLRLEVTEGALLEQPELVQGCLGRLRDAGVLTLLDDFGTGYSSLSYLHRFPLHGLKVDRSFVAELRSGDTGSGSTIVRAIQLMAQSLGLEVIAEGIETQEQCLQLQQLGLSLGQGYLFAKPASAADVLARYRLADGA
ncbi:MAG: EAL domain-containing protein [Arenimonas sp.]|nr:EAL domain-containing protein [Arenimonas sp.]